MIGRAEIEAAAARIDGRVRVTPTIEVELDGRPLVLKLELLQHTGSFKPRGAFHRLLTGQVPATGVIAASGGNHGLAVAYAAARLGHPAEIFVPAVTPAIKVERIRAQGAAVTVAGDLYDDALAASMERAEETGAMVVHAYDQPEVVAGQGTLGRELEGQVPDLDTVLVAVGGGGLIAGVAAWLGERRRVVAVEPELAPTLSRALQAGRPVPVEVAGVAADSLGAKQLGTIAFQVASRYVDAAVLVPDGAIRRAQRVLWDELRLVAEPGGATALAAWLSGSYRPAPAERVVVLVCGANTDPATVAADT